MRLTKEYCEAVARSCSDTKEFWYRHRSVAQKALREGWYEEYSWLPRFRVPRNHWTEEACKAEARKYRSVREFREKSPTAYVTANREGWAMAYTWLEREVAPKGIWTEDRCLEEAKKYGTKTEFLKGSPNAYYTACRKGWLKAYTFLERKRRSRKESVKTED